MVHTFIPRCPCRKLSKNSEYLVIANVPVELTLKFFIAPGCKPSQLWTIRISAHDTYVEGVTLARNWRYPQKKMAM